jgi:hypothetical protein
MRIVSSRWSRLDRELLFIEHSAQSKNLRLTVARLRRYIDILHYRIHGLFGRRVDPEVHLSIRSFERRVRTSRSLQDVRTLIRDLRQFQLALSSTNRTSELEARLEELEEQVKTPAVTGSRSALEEKETVTLESLSKKSVLFAIMPFAPDFSDVWTGGIKRAATGTGLAPVRIDMLTQATEITDDIVEVINRSKVVVIDVTGNNPNVMFEFGFALAKNKKPVIISQSADYLTFDIKHIRTIIYQNTWQGIETLHKDLQPYIRAAMNGKPPGGKSRKPKSSDKTSPKNA